LGSSRRVRCDDHCLKLCSRHTSRADTELLSVNLPEVANG
jgi:hypothetical protein